MSIIGYSNGIEWVKEFFIKKGRLFLKVLDSKWETAEIEAVHVARLLESIGVDKESTILDLGCGNGRIAINLAKLGYRVIGVDISPIFVEDAKKKAKEHGVEDKVEFFTGDARELDKVLRGKLFDATIMYWTTILGYYLDKKTDVMILRNIWKVTKPEGYLLILNHAGLELVSFRNGFCGAASYMSELDEEIVMVEKPELDPTTAIIKNTWIFYKKEGKDLKYIDEISFELRVYAFHEIVEMAKEAGWSFHSAYRDITTLRPYRPGLSSINIVLQKKTR